MGVFEDKKFDGLDWVSQALEPIDTHLNVILADLPEEFEIDFETYKKIQDNGYQADIKVGEVLSYISPAYKKLGWRDCDVIRDCFEFIVPEGLLIDFEQNTFVGGLPKIVKHRFTLDEKVIENMLGYDGMEAVGTMYGFDPAQCSRANEIMELLGECDRSAYNSKLGRKKRYAITGRLRTIFKTNEWKIKDAQLANKVGFWIKDYIDHGNLAAYSNFCRLKVMTHKELPIYSMEEIV